MKLRVARHTNDFAPLIEFYCDAVGLAQLGGFHDHDGYDGIFLGKDGADWHLEYTKSGEAPNHHPDDDDLLVFYVETGQEYTELNQQIQTKGFHPVEPANPYWKANGMTYVDPDGFCIVISIRK
ncbi:VOC family protein [Prolixibacter denitrificans]|uniref:Glyoxalase/bleomycin resistance protein/dioxygenase superfamily protein n=1 Tax=Prolixibacter denitrificans TaxID=1541063 RepID=A0A2P8CFA6_9BACT|nr:VOC family protein [Prolixibacter denitrificans]PSK83658.1 hypothetical protein CLV93_10373 [Prolixibacter denitrificans]GET23205.1 hypothetical protein JCM18694_34510 [Prolixibacter denitrificans]